MYFILCVMWVYVDTKVLQKHYLLLLSSEFYLDILKMCIVTTKLISKPSSFQFEKHCSKWTGSKMQIIFKIVKLETTKMG